MSETKRYCPLIDALLDDAFQVLQHDTGEADAEWHALRDHLAEKFSKTLRKHRKQRNRKP